MKLTFVLSSLPLAWAYGDPHEWIPGGPNDCTKPGTLPILPDLLMICSPRAMSHDEHSGQSWLPPS